MTRPISATRAALLGAVLALAGLLASCKPAAGSRLRDYGSGGAGDADQMVARLENARLTLRPLTGAAQLTDLKEIWVAGDHRGRLDPQTARQFIRLADSNDGHQVTLAPRDRLTFDITVGMAPDRICQTALPAATGVGLRGNLPLRCATGADRLRELHEACRDLARDPQAAVYDAAAAFCTCPRRKDPQVAYLGYLGRTARFLLACRNTAAPDELRGLCLETRDPACASCRADATSCSCKRGATLRYQDYLNDVERFRGECPLPAVNGFAPTGA
jgi:hypothetical protein